MQSQFNGQRAYDFLNKINFVRLGGTDNEKKAAQIIKSELNEIGLESKFQEFKIATSHGFRSEFKVVGPYEKQIKISHRVLSGTTPSEGIKADFKYIESGGERYCKNIKDKVVMIVGRIDRYVYERLVRHDVKAVLVPVNYNQDLFTVGYDIDFVNKYGHLPICFIGYDDALEMLKSGAKKVYLRLEDQVELEGTGLNVSADIKGTLNTEDEFLFVGHYDTVLCNGIYDNGAGTATLIELARYFNKNKPKRNIKFLFFSGEELGLRGSRAYISELKESDNNHLKRIKMVFNFDLGGTILGRNCLRVTGSDEMFYYIDAWNKIKDWDFVVENDIYSSDNMPFASEGIPSINFFRSSLGIGHALNDSMEHISPEPFRYIGEFAIELTSGIINASVLPFKSKLSEEIRNKVKHYFDITSPEEPTDE